MNRRGLLLGLGAAMTQGAVLAQPRPYRFDPKGDPSLLRLSSAATAVRAQGAIGASGLLAHGMISSVAATTLEIAGIGRTGANGLLNMFFASTQILLGHVENATPVVGYYSPTIDMWWLTLWSGSASPKVIEAKLIAGGQLVGRAPPVVPQTPRWIGELKRRTVIEALQSGARSAESAFTDEFAVDASTPPTLFDRLKSGPAEKGLFRSRLLGFAGALSDFSEDRRAYPVYDRVVRALTSPVPMAPASGLSVEARQGFASLARAPAPMRTRLSPVAAVRIEDSWIVISANPVSGRYLMLAAFQPTTPEPLQRLTLIDVLKPPGGR